MLASEARLREAIDSETLAALLTVPQHLPLMNLQQFRESPTLTDPPASLSLPVKALWWDAKGDWAKAHESAQEDEGPNGAWVHAYLHRKEGDSPNAAYWYRRAGQAVSVDELDVEWGKIVRALLD